jgi:hypothetical protein
MIFITSARSSKGISINVLMEEIEVHFNGE